MLVFDPKDPFPLLSATEQDYRLEKAHSAQVDAWLGFNTAEIESSVGKLHEQENWSGLPIQALMTPYTEIRFILNELAPRAGESLIDLGAAYGRMGFVIARHYRELSFQGFELEPARVEEGRRSLNLFLTSQPKVQVELQVADLESASFRMPTAEYYFIYDFGTRRAIEKTLEDLRLVAIQRSLTVVGRGRRVRDLIERGQPWLSQVAVPRHFERFSIYRSR